MWLTDGLQGHGTFLFHNGIDIAAPEGTPVYPVVSGRVHYIDNAAIMVRTTDHRVFQYFHLILRVRDGEDVLAEQTVLGYVMRAYKHVHLSEIRGERVWNPLAPGGIAPYRDKTIPEVNAIVLVVNNDVMSKGDAPPVLHLSDRLFLIAQIAGGWALLQGAEAAADAVAQAEERTVVVEE